MKCGVGKINDENVVKKSRGNQGNVNTGHTQKTNMLADTGLIL